MHIVEIRVNCPNQDTAEEISRALLKKRLIAASNILQETLSSYHWKGMIERATEVPLLMKTHAALFDQVVEQAKALHPYETLSITGIVIDHVDDDYRAWVLAETAGAKLD